MIDWSKIWPHCNTNNVDYLLSSISKEVYLYNMRWIEKKPYMDKIDVQPLS